MLLLHAGELGAARAELRAYMATAAFSLADPFDRALCTQASPERERGSIIFYSRVPAALAAASSWLCSSSP